MLGMQGEAYRGLIGTSSASANDVAAAADAAGCAVWVCALLSGGGAVVDGGALEPT